MPFAAVSLSRLSAAAVVIAGDVPSHRCANDITPFDGAGVGLLGLAVARFAALGAR